MHYLENYSFEVEYTEFVKTTKKWQNYMPIIQFEHSNPKRPPNHFMIRNINHRSKVHKL